MKSMKKFLCGWIALLMLLGMLSSNGWSQIFSAASASSAGGIVLEAENCNPIFSPEWEQKNIRHGTGSEGHDSFSFVQAKQNLGQTVEFTLSVEVAGEYEIYVVTKDAYNRGIFDFSVDNEKIGTVDFYNPQSGVFVEHKIGNATLQAGDNILLATLIGRNSANTTLYGCAFDYFVLVSTEDKSIYFETEALNWTVSEGWTKATKAHGAGVENHGTFDYLYTYSIDGQSVTYTLPVEKAGNYEIYSMSKDGTNRATFQFSLNGEEIGAPVDQYNAASGFVEHKVGVAVLKAGDNNLTITLCGKNAALSGSQLNGTFDYFRLVPTGEAPDTQILLECESVTWTLTGNWNQKNQKQGNGASGHGKFSFVQTTTNAEQAVSFPITVANSGNYKIFLGTKDDKTRGKFTVAVNGTSICEMDQYAPSASFTEHELGIATLSSGSNTVTFTLIGKNPANTSSNFGGTFDYFRLVPTNEDPTPEYVIPELIYDERFDTLTEDFSDWELIDTIDGKAMKGTTLLKTLASLGKINGPFTMASDFLMIDSKGGVGLTFAKVDDENFHHFRFVFQHGSMVAQLYRWSGGSATLIAQKNLGTKNIPVRLRVTYDGKALSCYVDGVLVLSNTLALSEGNVGFRLYNTVSLIDNLQIYTGVVAPSEGGESSTDFAMNTAVQIQNNENPGYEESEGTFVSVSGGHDGSEARVSDGGLVLFDTYPPAKDTKNYIISYYLPASDGAAVAVDVTSLNGSWKFTIPENAPEGWYKLGIISASEGTAVSVAASSEGKLYADAVKLEETLFNQDDPYAPSGFGGSADVAVLVNQIGYDCGTSKRATVTNVAEGTLFQLISVADGQVVYSGTVSGNIADFTAFNTDSDQDFYVECAGARSYEFTIGKNLIQRRSVVNSLAFMNQARSDTFEWGLMKNLAWRDSAQFSFELNGLVLQYMANPAVYDAMEFGIVEAETCQYEDLRVQDEPDIVWLIQFAALRYYDLGHDQGKNLHMLTKEQLAYYLYLYPAISQYVPKETYEKIRDYTMSVWGINKVDSDVYWQGVSGTNHNLYALQDVFGGLKGSQPPGHSIVPNLMMYEVAKRDGLGDDVAQKFFDAAYINAEYLIGNEFDLNDPFYNKGQRVSEYITVPALCYFLEEYPDKAPEGLMDAIKRWAVTTILRGDNMWDVRKAVSMAAGDGQYYFHNPNLSNVALSQDYWTGPAYAEADNQAEYYPGHGTPQNEPGNLAGFQAITYAAARVLGTGETSDRLKSLGVAAIDNLFGRNPTGRAAFYDFTRDFEGGDLGWHKQFKTGYGMLGGLTAVIDGSAPESSYPYAPENYNTGYTEGWVAYNSAWNTALAYAASDGIRLIAATEQAKAGDTVKITLSGPLNLDGTKIESGYVFVKNLDTGIVAKITVTESGTDSDCFTALYVMPDASGVEFSYGYGLFEHTASVLSVSEPSDDNTGNTDDSTGTTDSNTGTTDENPGTSDNNLGTAVAIIFTCFLAAMTLILTKRKRTS